MSTSTNVQLQINTAGAWRLVVKLDMGKTDQSAKAMSHACGLAQVVGARLRIVTDDGTQRAISHWNDKATGWVDAVIR